MAYLTQYATANDSDFLKRVTMAMLDYAHDVVTENSGTVGHAQRVVLATNVLLNPGSRAGAFSEAICAFATTLSSDSTDQNIKDAIASIWNGFAGIA